MHGNADIHIRVREILIPKFRKRCQVENVHPVIPYILVHA